METNNYILAPCLDGASQSVTVKLPNRTEQKYPESPLNCQEDTLPEELAGTSSGDQRPSCASCGKSFSRKAGLSRHTLTHTDDKRYWCDFCGVRFSRSFNLRTHQCKIQGSNGPYECELSGERPHKCMSCGKSFSLKTTLTRHMLTHTGEKRYSCDICGRRFSLGGNLRRHRKIHGSNGQYECELSGTGHLTKVASDDNADTEAHNNHAGSTLQEQMPRSVENEILSLADGSQPPDGYPPSRDGRASNCHPHNPRNSPSSSDALAETLAHLKNINLTPVTEPAPLKMAAIDEHTMIGLPEAILPPPSVFQQHHKHQQPSHMSPATKLAPKPVAPGQPPCTNLASDLNKTTAMPKTLEMPKSSAISIFPVADKKSEDAVPPTAFQSETSSCLPSEGHFYASNYGTQQQFAGNYSSVESQFQCDLYKQNYHPDFASQFEYSSQSSFYYPQYQLGAYSGHGFAGLYDSENSAQYSNATAGIYPNQSSSQSYDQYGSFYGNSQTNEASQPATREPPSQ